MISFIQKIINRENDGDDKANPLDFLEKRKKILQKRKDQLLQVKIFDIPTSINTIKISGPIEICGEVDSEVLKNIKHLSCTEGTENSPWHDIVRLKWEKKGKEERVSVCVSESDFNQLIVKIEESGNVDIDLQIQYVKWNGEIDFFDVKFGDLWRVSRDDPNAKVAVIAIHLLNYFSGNYNGPETLQ